MFSNLIRYVASYITGGSLNEEISSDEKDTGGKFITDSNDTDETPEPDCNQTNKLEEEEDIVEPAEGNGQQTNNSSGNTSNALEQTLYGTVTSFFNTRGLINDEIYFSQEVIIGSDHPKVGDNVAVKASRSHKAGGWVATSVQITALWDIDDDEETQAKPVKDNIIGTVIKLYGNMVQIKATIDFQVPIRKFKTGYRPFNGDWVNIEIWNKGDEFQVSGIQLNDIISISPLREKKITGTVTDIQSRNGVINSEVYFSFAICKRGTFYKKGDKVSAMVIESKQTQGNWRAVYIEHIKKEEKEGEPRTAKDVSLRNIFNGISITKELAFGDINLDERQKKTIFIRNQGQKPVTFQSLNLSIPVPGFLFKLKNRGHRNSRNNRDVHMLSPNLILNPGEKRELPVEFIPSNIGKVEFNVTFHFDTFELVTLGKANIVDSIQQEMQREITPFKAPQTFFGKKVNASFADATSVIPGQRLVRKKKVFLPNKLARYPIPNHVKTCLMNLDGDIELLVPELAQPLHISNYTRKLSTLLYAEEIKMEAEMRQFDLFQVILRKSHEYLTLDVPGLAEGRPSLLLGDRVVVQYHGQANSPTYEGFIHEIQAETILLKFDNHFHETYEHQYVDAQFHFNRTPLRRCHQAIEHAMTMGEETLFPSKLEEKEPLIQIAEDDMVYFNKRLNERQRKAVHRIVCARGRPIPYVLFGPPGTGKSVTVVESILQVFKRISHSRILACAPSNSAADLIAERLHLSGHVSKRDMVRMNAFQRSKINLPECITHYCTSDTDDLHFVSRHRIIIATCNMAGYLYSFDLKVGHFTHIFVDEAGQSTEPECMIPAGFAAGSEESQIILAGDPYQLGPVLRSDISQDYGLNISLLERLCNSPLYQRDEETYKDSGCYNPLLVTKLINNYRSHSSLLHLPSSLFYHHELVAHAEDSLVKHFEGSRLLPNPKVPFIFHGVRAEDFREGDSPSWFNPAEAVEVIKYVQTIMRIYPNRFDVSDIGIITPYRKQVEKIRVLLDRFDLSAIKVGSVEEFQGQERQIIIISTVRSTEDFVAFDCRHNIGFLSNPKRFNVSITRAQSLMVIVGNPIVLCYDAYWCAIIQYAVLNDCYKGCNLPPLDNDIVKENFQKALVMLDAFNAAETEETNSGNDDDNDEINVSEGDEKKENVGEDGERNDFSDSEDDDDVVIESVEDMEEKQESSLQRDLHDVMLEASEKQDEIYLKDNTMQSESGIIINSSMSQRHQNKTFEFSHERSRSDSNSSSKSSRRTNALLDSLNASSKK